MDRRSPGPGDLLVPAPVPRWRRLPRPTRRVAAVGCVLAAVVLTAHLAADAATRRRAWGEAVPVLVVREAVPEGAVLAADDLTRRELPVALVPDGAIAAPDAEGAAVGRVAITDLVPGEVLVGARLAADAFAAGAGVGPRGRTLAVPLDLPAPPVDAGDRVDLLAPAGTTDPTQGARPPDAAVVAADAVVVAADDATLVVAVAGPDVPRVVGALLQHTVVAVVRPG